MDQVGKGEISVEIPVRSQPVAQIFQTPDSENLSYLEREKEFVS